MLIREAIIDDAPIIAILLDQLGYPNAEAFIITKVHQQLSHPDTLLLVAEKDKQVLGFINLHFIPQLALGGDFCRISYFCISENARGLGLGRKLLERAETEAKARGCDRLEVHCHSRRKLAHRFYRQQGYQESPKYLLKMLPGSN
ncbi:GNAT family N-acetyltransferase [Spirulina sp. 06S082]|uniref:GNAT family N-acetyltransferase n=1 Tax=Spirulina sp. 06S082 TaxID=3110248 RepID=UPI002B201910|nr:GNAT family N-acetyltransferase [Spirulina sp. 06S082]MEA5471294.1 GNAT family N-acetyltransferase [Spirulina sp. 06S082]